MAKNKWSDDATVLAEGRKYASRTAFAVGSCGAYVVAKRRNLLDQLYPSKNAPWSDEGVLAEGRKYASRSKFMRGSCGAYEVALQRGLLDQLYPSTLNDWSDDATVLAEGRKYASRAEFRHGTSSAYNAARRRGLLDQLYPSSLRDLSDDSTVLAEGRKYGSRGEFQSSDCGAYGAALRRNLLDQMTWFARPLSDNDAIYIWRAVGEYFNGNPIYKIGVTSARLGEARVEGCANKAGFEFDLVCCEPVQCKATDLEKKLLILGENPCYVGIDGYSEFRALSDSALYAAVSLICSAI